MKLLKLFQFMWEHGTIPAVLGFTILILIPKGNSDTQGMEAIIDTHINKAITFHDILHRLSVGRGTRIAIMELKLTQDLPSVDQDPLLLVFLDLIKVYDKLDHGQLLETLDVYREGGAGNYGGVLGVVGGGPPTKWIPWPPVQGDPRNHTSGNDIFDII